MMCDYCNVNYIPNREPLIFAIGEDEHGERVTAQIDVGTIKRNKLVFSLKSGADEFIKTKEINYCPMCGRKLNG